jgi:hypothetical protein
MKGKWDWHLINVDDQRGILVRHFVPHHLDEVGRLFHGLVIVLLGGVHCCMMTEAHLLHETKNCLLASFYALCHEVWMQADAS